jgi:glutathione synthase/RimK-type ligase-like ATP-grasp enzyme
MSGDVRIGVGRDRAGWYGEIVNALERARLEGVRVQFELVDLEGHRWASNARGYDAIIWNPGYMGPVSASFVKEKIHFLQNILGIRVMPNFESVWHFESKVAQSYLLEALEVPRPRTVVSFEHRDAREAARELGLPLVAKKAHGAASSNVVLLKTEAEVDRYLEREFAQELWHERKLERGSAVAAALSSPFSPFFREKVRRRMVGAERHGYVYLQEFVPGNDSDLRLNAIGRRVAGCRRLNRAGDFRASGSHLETYPDDLPRDAVDLCMHVRERMGADCLAMDVLYRDGQPLIVEMCYVEALTHYLVHLVKQADGSYTLVKGEAWERELWVKHMLDVLGL